MDGRYSRLRFSGKGGPRRSMGESDIRTSAYIMGVVDVDRGTGLEAQIGAVVRFVREADVSTPLSIFIYHSLLPMELRAQGQFQFGE
jgi:hypothetical protein